LPSQNSTPRRRVAGEYLHEAAAPNFYFGEQGRGSKLGWANVGLVVVVVAVDFPCLVVVVDVVVVVGTVVATVGGCGVCKASFGGGFVGAVSSLPNI
jgi:hypothetical protein